MKVCDAYAKWAATFDSSESAIVALETRILTPRLPEVAGKRVVDVGCGTGRWLAWMVDRGACASGIDVSPQMLREAARKQAAAGRVACADALRAPVRDGCADVVISTLAIGHLRPISRAMAEIARIAAPGATVMVTDFHPDALRRGWKRTFKSGGETIEIDSDPYSIDELRDARLTLEDFCEAGFETPERAIFEAADKGALFDQVRGASAILVARYRKTA